MKKLLMLPLLATTYLTANETLNTQITIPLIPNIPIASTFFLYMISLITAVLLIEILVLKYLIPDLSWIKTITSVVGANFFSFTIKLICMQISSKFLTIILFPLYFMAEIILEFGLVGLIIPTLIGMLLLLIVAITYIPFLNAIFEYPIYHYLLKTIKNKNGWSLLKVIFRVNVASNLLIAVVLYQFNPETLLFAFTRTPHTEHGIVFSDKYLAITSYINYLGSVNKI